MHMDMQRICINVSYIKGHVAVAHLWMHVEVLRTQASWHASATWTLLILSILTVGWCMCAVGCQACIMLVLVQCINRSAPTATGVSVGQLCLRPFQWFRSQGSPRNLPLYSGYIRQLRCQFSTASQTVHY